MQIIEDQSQKPAPQLLSR